MWEKLTQPLFAGLRDARFQMSAEGGDSIEVVLTEVSDLRTTPRQEEFAIVFSGPAEPALVNQWDRAMEVAGEPAEAAAATR